MKSDFAKLLGRVSEDPDLPQVVLLSTGAFAPVHRGHVKMFEAAKQHLEAQGIHVVGGLMSPSHDDYVGGKGIDISCSLSAKNRCAMVDLVTRASDWLCCSRWESQAVSYFVDYPQVVSYHIKELRKLLPPTSKLAVFYVCGSDHALKHHLLHRSPTWADGLVVMQRRGEASAQGQGPSLIKQMRTAVAQRVNVFLVEHDSCDRSSTAVRRAIRDARWDLVDELCGEDVATFLKSSKTIKTV